uniref:Uncharacterized protein n=1 Tax=Amphimedon queenslandica TaxID=400682 RepID=A0A1X7VNI8_AMPQE
MRQNSPAFTKVIKTPHIEPKALQAVVEMMSLT